MRLYNSCKRIWSLSGVAATFDFPSLVCGSSRENRGGATRARRRWSGGFVQNLCLGLFGLEKMECMVGLVEGSERGNGGGGEFSMFTMTIAHKD